MSEPKKPLFRESSLNRLSTPEQLTDYLSVTSVNLYVALAAVVVLLATMLAWAVAGKIAVYEHIEGFQMDGEVHLFVQDPALYRPGMRATVDGSAGTVTAVAPQPASKADIARTHSEYMVYELRIPEYSYEVNIEAPGLSDGPVDITIIREQISPISFITGQGDAP